MKPILRKTIYPSALLVLLLSALALPGRFQTRTRAEDSVGKKTDTAVASKPNPVATEKLESYTVVKSDINSSILVTGELKAARTRDLAAPEVRSMFGSSITYMAEEGIEVKQGDRILEFDASTLMSQKNEAQRVLDEAKLKIEKTKADLDVQKADLLIEVSNATANLKVAELYAKIDKSLLPANTFQKYQLDYEKAQLALSKAKERLANLTGSIPAQIALVEVDRDQAEIYLKKIEGDIARMLVDAPQDGIIIYGDNWASQRKFQIGDMAFRGMPVMTLPDLSSLQVVANVYDTELRFLSPNMICDLTLDALPGRSWKGKIISLTSVATKKSFASLHKIFKAVIELEKVEIDVMKPGMTAKIEVPVSFATQVVAVPREYLGIDIEGKYYVQKGTDVKTTSKQVVEVGPYSDRLVQILSGVTVGDHLLPVQKTLEAKP